MTWKKAHPSLSKSEKAKAAELREEITFLERIPSLHPHLLEMWGEKYWEDKYMSAMEQYIILYPGRDLKELLGTFNDS